LKKTIKFPFVCIPRYCKFSLEVKSQIVTIDVDEYQVVAHMCFNLNEVKVSHLQLLQCIRSNLKIIFKSQCVGMQKKNLYSKY